jgi:hypothetical protein
MVFYSFLGIVAIGDSQYFTHFGVLWQLAIPSTFAPGKQVITTE